MEDGLVRKWYFPGAAFHVKPRDVTLNWVILWFSKWIDLPGACTNLFFFVLLARSYSMNKLWLGASVIPQKFKGRLVSVNSLGCSLLYLLVLLQALVTLHFKSLIRSLYRRGIFLSCGIQKNELCYLRWCRLKYAQIGLSTIHSRLNWFNRKESSSSARSIKKLFHQKQMQTVFNYLLNSKAKDKIPSFRFKRSRFTNPQFTGSSFSRYA